MAKLKIEYTAQLPNPSGWAIALALAALIGGSIPIISILNQSTTEALPSTPSVTSK